MDLAKLNIDQLGKGSVLEPQTLSAFFGVSLDDRRYTMRILELRDAVSDHFRTKRGEVVTLAIRDDALHVLSDEEAAEYNRRDFERGVRALRRAHRRNLAVNLGQLGGKDRAEHLRALESQGRQALALSRERRRQERWGELRPASQMAS